MTGNNPRLDLVDVDARKKRMVRFCEFILKILSGNEILTSIKGRNALKIYRKITGNNPKLDIVNVDVHTNFGQILSIRSQDIERKRNSDVNQGLYSVKILRKMTGNSPKLDHANVDVHTKFGQILSIHSPDIERNQNSDINQGP